MLQALQAEKRESKQPESCRLVYVKNLPYDVTELEVKEAFSRCGIVTSVRLPVWNHTKKLKGFGYVRTSCRERQ
jgi:nucleolin